MSRAIPTLTTLVLVSFVASVARAQSEPPEPSAPPPQNDCAHHPDDPGCKPMVPVKPAAPPSTPPAPDRSAGGTSGSGIGSFSGGNCGGGGGGSGAGVAILAAAVVGAALLPVIVYVVDDDASPEARAHWEGLSTRVIIYGGTTSQANNPSAGFVGGRAQVGYQLLGLEAGIESSTSPAQYATGDAAVMLRLPPRAHVELGFSFGGKVLQLDGHRMSGVEIAVPHRYLFGSLFQGRVAFDVRPSVAFNSNDLALLLDGGLQIPLPGQLAARISGRVYSLNHDIEASAFGGLELGL